MRKKKRIIMLNDGWAFSEHKMLNKLSQYASQGWILEKATTFKFHLREGEPQMIQYAMDYQPKVEDIVEYKKMFEAAGWDYVCDCYGFYIFKAKLETTKIHTDSTLLEEWRQKEKQKSILLILISLIGIFTFYYLARYLDYSPILSNLFLILFVIMAVLLGVSVALTYAWIFRKGK